MLKEEIDRLKKGGAFDSGGDAGGGGGAGNAEANAEI